METAKRSCSVCKDVIAFPNRHAPWATFKWETGDCNSRVHGGRDGSAHTILALMDCIPADDLARVRDASMAGL